MGKEKMVTMTLTKEMIEAGAALIRRLDERGFQSEAVFWFYFPDIQQWKLVLAAEKLPAEGPRQLYKNIQETLSSFPGELGVISLENVTLAKPDAPVVSLLRLAIRTGPEIGGIRFTNNVINGTVIDDAYIYRLV